MIIVVLVLIQRGIHKIYIQITVMTLGDALSRVSVVDLVPMELMTYEEMHV